MSPAESNIPLSQFLAVLRLRWKRLLLLITVTSVVAVVVALLLPHRYEAELVAIPRGTDRSALLGSLGQLGGLAALAGLGSAESSQRAEAIQMLQSQILARQFIEDNKLIPVLYEKQWDAARKTWKGKERTLNDAVELFDHSIRNVIEDRRSGLVTLRITWRDPVQAADWANELVRRANETLRHRAVVRAQGAIDYLKREARESETIEVQQSLYRLMEEQYKTLLLANVSNDYSFSVIDPAIAPDAKHYVFPRKRLFGLGGLFFGLVIALIAVFIEASQRSTVMPAGSGR